jgi:predicted nucleic acid-binding protein
MAATKTTLTFLDSGVILWAVRGNIENARRADEILNDSMRAFASSPFVKLETMTKAMYFNIKEQREAYEAIFSAVQIWAEPNTALVEKAFEIARDDGLAAMDALHVAAAVMVGAREFITTEKREKSIHRTKALPIISIHS